MSTSSCPPARADREINAVNGTAAPAWMTLFLTVTSENAGLSMWITSAVDALVVRMMSDPPLRILNGARFAAAAEQAEQVFDRPGPEQASPPSRTRRSQRLIRLDDLASRRINASAIVPTLPAPSVSKTSPGSMFPIQIRDRFGEA